MFVCIYYIDANGYEILPVFNMTQLSWLELWETDPLPVLDGLCQREDAFECLEICNPPNYVSICLTKIN